MNKIEISGISDIIVNILSIPVVITLRSYVTGETTVFDLLYVYHLINLSNGYYNIS
jgi:hypothetical protein